MMVRHLVLFDTPWVNRGKNSFFCESENIINVAVEGFAQGNCHDNGFTV